MGRTDNDSWDLASSVGVTATVVAMQRAIATRSGTAGVNDPYAEPLVSAVGVPTYIRHARGESGDEAPADAVRMADGIAARTRWSTNSSRKHWRPASVSSSSWPPVWTLAPTGCPGPPTRRSTNWTRPR